MKIKLVLLFLVSLCIIACTQDETQLPSDTSDQVVNLEKSNSINGNLNANGDNNRTLTLCSNWTAPVAPMGTQGTIWQITFSDNPNHYPGGFVDIECTRKEYFDRFCDLKMTQIQNSDPFKDTWIATGPDISQDPPCVPRPKDDVGTASNGDPRVCVGTECDD